MIIAEIGQNFCGDIELAEDLIHYAKREGADKAKFQLYNHDKLYHNHPEIADCSLSFDQAKHLFEYGKRDGIEVFFSVFDTEKIEWCERIGVGMYKLAYSQKDNQELRDAIRATGKPVLVSGDDLYCVPNYPAKIDDINWYDMRFYKGFSDHTIGLTAAKIALAHGRTIIEKHFAIDHKTGVDAPWSMTPGELSDLKEWHDQCLTLSLL